MNLKNVIALSFFSDALADVYETSNEGGPALLNILENITFIVLHYSCKHILIKWKRKHFRSRRVT